MEPPPPPPSSSGSDLSDDLAGLDDAFFAAVKRKKTVQKWLDGVKSSGDTLSNTPLDLANESDRTTSHIGERGVDLAEGTNDILLSLRNSISNFESLGISLTAASADFKPFDEVTDDVVWGDVCVTDEGGDGKTTRPINIQDVFKNKINTKAEMDGMKGWDTNMLNFTNFRLDDGRELVKYKEPGFPTINNSRIVEIRDRSLCNTELECRRRVDTLTDKLKMIGGDQMHNLVSRVTEGKKQETLSLRNKLELLFTPGKAYVDQSRNEVLWNRISHTDNVVTYKPPKIHPYHEPNKTSVFTGRHYKVARSDKGNAWSGSLSDDAVNVALVSYPLDVPTRTLPLEILHVKNTSINNLDKTLEACPNLKVLSVKNTLVNMRVKLTSSLVSVTIRSSNIESVKASGMNSLRHLDLSSNNLKDIEIGDTYFLEFLDLSKNKLKTVPEFVRSSNNLKVLLMNENELSGCLTLDLPLLTTLSVEDNKITGIKGFFPSLTDINASFNEIDFKNSLVTLRRSVPQLRQLTLTDNPIASDPSFYDALRKFPSLCEVGGNKVETRVSHIEKRSARYLGELFGLSAFSVDLRKSMPTVSHVDTSSLDRLTPSQIVYSLRERQIKVEGKQKNNEVHGVPINDLVLEDEDMLGALRDIVKSACLTNVRNDVVVSPYYKSVIDDMIQMPSSKILQFCKNQLRRKRIERINPTASIKAPYSLKERLLRNINNAKQMGSTIGTVAKPRIQQSPSRPALTPIAPLSPKDFVGDENIVLSPLSKRQEPIHSPPQSDETTKAMQIEPTTHMAAATANDSEVVATKTVHIDSEAEDYQDDSIVISSPSTSDGDELAWVDSLLGDTMMEGFDVFGSDNDKFESFLSNILDGMRAEGALIVKTATTDTHNKVPMIRNNNNNTNNNINENQTTQITQITQAVQMAQMAHPIRSPPTPPIQQANRRKTGGVLQRTNEVADADWLVTGAQKHQMKQPQKISPPPPPRADGSVTVGHAQSQPARLRGVRIDDEWDFSESTARVFAQMQLRNKKLKKTKAPRLPALPAIDRPYSMTLSHVYNPQRKPKQPPPEDK